MPEKEQRLVDCLSEIFGDVINDYQNSPEDLFFLLEFFSTGHADLVQESFLYWFPPKEATKMEKQERHKERKAQRHSYYQ